MSRFLFSEEPVFLVTTRRAATATIADVILPMFNLVYFPELSL